MIFGSQKNAYAYHQEGYTAPKLTRLLYAHGFTKVELLQNPVQASVSQCDLEGDEVKTLLVHTTDVEVPVLRPAKIHDGDVCVCFSEDRFIPHFGGYLYVFEKETLERNFVMRHCRTGGIFLCQSFPEDMYHAGPVHYRFRSEDLEWEYRVYQPIDVAQYALGVLHLFDVMKGELEVRLRDEIVSREMLHLKRDRSPHV